MFRLALLLLPLAAHAQQLAQTELPAAVPYTGEPAQTTQPPAAPSFTAPMPSYGADVHTVSYTVTLSGTFPNPREEALKIATTEGLKMVLENRNPPATPAQIATLAEQGDAAKLLTTYTITQEVLTPQYQLTTQLSFNPRLINQALQAEGAMPQANLPSAPAGATLTLRYAHPTARSLHVLLGKAAAAIPGTRADVFSLAADAALIAITTPDADAFLARLAGQGLRVESVGTTYWVQ